MAQEATVEAERLQLQQLSGRVERGQASAYELDNAVRHLEGLIRQQQDRHSGLAEREQIASRELRELDAQRDGLLEEARTLRSALAELEAEEQEAQDSLTEVSREHDARRLTAQEAESALSSANTRLSEAGARVAHGEAVLGGFEARREGLRGQIERLEQEVEALATRKVEFEQQRGELEARMTGLRSGKVETAERQREVEETLVARKESLQAVDVQVEELRERLAVSRSRLRSLTEIQERFEGLGAGARALMTSYVDGRGSRVAGLVADRLQCDPELTSALGAALGAALEWLVVEDVDAALGAIDFLKQNQEGRATFVPRHPVAPPRVVPSFPFGEGVVGPLLERMRFAPEDQDWAKHLLHDVLVVDALTTAVRLHREGYRGKLVSLDGQALLPDGRVVGGAKDESTSHHLQMKAEIRELTEEVSSLDGQLQSAVQQQGELRSHIAERQAEIDAARTRAHDAEIETLGAERDLREAEGELGRIAERTEEIAGLTRDARESLAAIDADEAEARKRLQDARRLVDEATEAVQAGESVLAERRRVVEEQSARVTEVKVRTTQARERADRERSVLVQLERSASEIEAREERLRGDVASAHRDQGQAAGRILLHQGRLAETAHDAAQARDEASVLRGQLDEAQVTLGESEAALKKLRGCIDEQSSELNELTLRDRELTLAMEHLEEQIEARYRLELRTVIGDYHARPIPDAATRERAAELQRLIDRMGEINLTAIEEYEENAERYEYLQGQRTDLQDALSKLERAIRQMNKESRVLFREAFAGINERFKRIFPILFRGGKAELRLSNPQDLLETGVEIIAQPPGKRLGSLELMSGGEKALTAVALIFAVFQYKPSPFCLLDEVDAPLDEANIGRFAEAIKQMTDRSQFIVITHSKRTMEYADVLYGVTMEQPGVSKLVSVELRGQKRPIREPAPSVEAAE